MGEKKKTRIHNCKNFVKRRMLTAYYFLISVLQSQWVASWEHIKLEE